VNPQAEASRCDIGQSWRPPNQTVSSYLDNKSPKTAFMSEDDHELHHAQTTYFCHVANGISSSKGKAVPQNTYGGGGERMSSSYSFTSALDGGEWSVSRLGCALPPGKGPPVPTGQEAGWAPEPVWTQRLKEKSNCLYILQ
jgi:hypothetical protein